MLIATSWFLHALVLFIKIWIRDNRISCTGSSSSIEFLWNSSPGPMRILTINSSLNKGDQWQVHYKEIEFGRDNRWNSLKRRVRRSCRLKIFVCTVAHAVCKASQAALEVIVVATVRSTEVNIVFWVGWSWRYHETKSIFFYIIFDILIIFKSLFE